VGNITVVFSFSILFLLLFQIIGPRVIGSELEDFDAEFTISDDEVLIGEVIQFDASSSEGDFVRYEWDFGDNNSDEGEQVSHSYADPGRYIVVLTAFTSDNDRSLAGGGVIVNLEHSDSGSIARSAEETYAVEINSKAEQLVFQGSVDYDAGDRGQITLTTPAQELSQSFNSPFGGNQDFDWEVADDGPGDYELVIEVFASSASGVNYEYSVSGQF